VAEPQQHLAELLEAWWQGQRAPLPFFAGAALEYAESGDLARANKLWESDYDSGAANWAVATAFRGAAPLAGEAFVELAGRLAAPLLAARALIKAEDDQ